MHVTSMFIHRMMMKTGGDVRREKSAKGKKRKKRKGKVTSKYYFSPISCSVYCIFLSILFLFLQAQESGVGENLVLNQELKF